MKAQVSKYQVRIDVAGEIGDMFGWTHSPNSPFIFDFEGTQDDCYSHLPAIGSWFGEGWVMAWEVCPK